MDDVRAVCPKCGKDVCFDSGSVRVYCPECGRMVIKADTQPAPSAEEAASLMSAGEALIAERNLAEAFAKWSAAVGALSSKDFAIWRDKMPRLMAEHIPGDLLFLQPDVQDGYIDVCETAKRRNFDLSGKTAQGIIERPITGKLNSDLSDFFILSVAYAVAIEYAADPPAMYDMCKAVQDRYFEYRSGLRDGEGKSLFAGRSMYNDAIKPFVHLGGLLNGKTRRLSEKKKDALNKLCAETELPPEIRGLVVSAVNWQIRRMATASMKENSQYKSNMKKDMKAFCDGYFGRFDY